MSGSAWFETPVAGTSTGTGGIPLAPTDPVEYLSWLLKYQAPLGGPGVILTPSYHWRFGPNGSLTDLVANETLSVSGTVPLTAWSGPGAVAPESSVNIQSSLVSGYASFNSVSDALVASTATVEDIVDSALLLWCTRFPIQPTALMGVVNKRENIAPNVGHESALNSQGRLISTLDFGATTAVLSLLENYTVEATDGVWHWFALLVDANRGQCMLASESEIGPWVSIPAGSLSTATLLSMGAGRLQSASMDLMTEIAFMGPTVEAIFNSPLEVESATNDPTGPNIMDNVCKVLALDTTMFLTMDPVT